MAASNMSPVAKIASASQLGGGGESSTPNPSTSPLKAELPT